MQLHELKRSTGLKDKARRKGRGNASKGNTAGRGFKGQKARAGHSQKAFFEGGQTPLVQRLPKLKGFKRYFKLIESYSVVNLSDIEKDDRITSEVTKEILTSTGHIRKGDKVKILGNGDFSKKLTFVGIDKFSKSAIEKIQKAGSTIKEAVE